MLDWWWLEAGGWCILEDGQEVEADSCTGGCSCHLLHHQDISLVHGGQTGRDWWDRGWAQGNHPHRGQWRGSLDHPPCTRQSEVDRREVGRDRLQLSPLRHDSPCDQTGYHCSCLRQHRRICNFFPRIKRKYLIHRTKWRNQIIKFSSHWRP